VTTYIGQNETCYSTQDLDRVAGRVFALLAGGELQSFDFPQEVSQLAFNEGYEVRLAEDRLPVDLVYWDEPERMGQVRDLLTGRWVAPTSLAAAGPWFVDSMSVEETSAGMVIALRVARLEDVGQHLSPLEMLTLAGEEAYLPPTMVAQLLLDVLWCAGVRVVVDLHQNDSPNSALALYTFLTAWCQGNPDARVGILKQDPERKRGALGTEEGQGHLLEEFTGGGSGRGEPWKRWTRGRR